MGRASGVSFWLLAAAGLVIAAGEDSHEGHWPHPGHQGPPDGDSGEGGGQGWGPRSGGEHGRPEGAPEMCSAEDSHNALQASSNYIACAGIDYADFIALVQADLGLLEGSALCFSARADELDHQDPPPDPDDVDVSELFADCVSQVSGADGTTSTAATAEFLNSMLGPDSKICSCLPDYVDKMPLCDHWQRFHHFGTRVEALCDTVNEQGGLMAMIPTPPPADGGESTGTSAATTTTTTDPQGNPTAATTEVKEAADKDGEKDETTETETKTVPHREPEDQRAPKFPNQAPPCQPGQEHPTDPTKCQPPQSEENEFYEDTDKRGPPPGAAGGMGFVVSILGIVGVGSLVGVGGVWLWDIAWGFQQTRGWGGQVYPYDMTASSS